MAGKGDWGNVGVSGSFTRRRFVVGCAAAVGVPIAVRAQIAGKVWLIGYLTPAELDRRPLIEALRDLGYIEGQTLRLEVRSADSNLDRLPQLAVALVHEKVDIIVAVSPPAIRAASQATRAIPIVMASWGGDGLLESGIVASFARPGANVTGVSILAAELDAKRFELLLAALPNAKRVAVLNPGSHWGAFTEVRRTAQAAKIQLHMSEVPGSAGYERVFENMSEVPGSAGYGHVFETMAKAQVNALLVPSFPQFFRDHKRIIELAGSHRIATIYEWGEIARAGGLMAYGPVRADIARRHAIYVDRILKGASPADLPIEQPKTFELVVNMKTAKSLGVTIPETILLRADELIR